MYTISEAMKITISSGKHNTRYYTDGCLEKTVSKFWNFQNPCFDKNLEVHWNFGILM